jgi:spore cortex formation protein SpoVR/YcgB (stage V sporulation)
MPRLSENERYYTKLVIEARDGSQLAERTIETQWYDIPLEILQWYRLSMKNDIYVGSAEHMRLAQLNAKYETDDVLNMQTC